MGSINLSIIIVSFNTRQVTLDCLNSIFRSLQGDTQPSYEVIVIDNASTDGSVEALHGLAETHPTLMVIENKENIGFGKANNQGAKLAKGIYILFINSDTVVLDRAIEKLLKYYQENEKYVHFLGGKLLNADTTAQPSAGPFYSPAVVFGALFLRGDYWGLTRYSPNEPRQVDWVSGACIFTTNDIFQKVGGFDEGIFMYMEEIDLLYRAKKLGFTTYFYPQARFTHFGSVSSGGRTYPILQVYRGFIYFYRKHYSPFSMLLLRCMLQLKAAISLMIGKLTGNVYLQETYGQAYKIAQMAGQ